MSATTIKRDGQRLIGKRGAIHGSAELACCVLEFHLAQKKKHFKPLTPGADYVWMKEV